jgi:acid phosphatase
MEVTRRPELRAIGLTIGAMTSTVCGDGAVLSMGEGMVLRLRTCRTYVRAALAAGVLLATATGTASASGHSGHHGQHRLKGVDHVVVIFQENHSFDNLYGGWEGVHGLRDADPAHTKQVNQAGSRFQCLAQNDPSLTSPPLSVTCNDPANNISSHFRNRPFRIDDYIPPTATTCPNGSPGGAPGGCTRDLVHRYYQEQYQLDGGKQDRYVTGSDAIGLTMGTYDTRALPIYEYLHSKRHPSYAIADRFFQSAFGGSFLNHQWLIAAATPTFPGAVNDGSANDLHAVVDANGMPVNYPLYHSPLGSAVKDPGLTASCHPPAGRPPTPAGVTCGDYAVNTMQPAYQPYAPGTAAAMRLPPQSGKTIGDELSAAKVGWAWYSGGWSNADGDVDAPGWTNGHGPTCSDPATAAGATYPNCPNSLFQYHHQPFNYYANYAPGTAARAKHLRDEQEFIAAARASKRRCGLKPVSFIKPVGAENEHPGYASEAQGSDHLVSLLKSIDRSRCAKRTMVIVTYDEFGGQWDDVSPPGQGNNRGPHDKWGPGTRVPALVITRGLRGRFVVDGASHDTTSVLATIEHRFGLAPLSSRDARVRDLSTVFDARPAHGAGHTH